LSKKKDSAAARELRKILRGERPREELIPLFEQLREKIFEENKVQDLDALLEAYRELYEDYIKLGWNYVDRAHELITIRKKNEKIKESLDIWRALAIVLLIGLLYCLRDDTMRVLQGFMTWIIDNRQWLFSGAGVTATVLSITCVYRRFFQKH
jgi:hypothetical protein